MRILHIADVHLDTAFAGRSDDTRNRLRQASRDALERSVETAIAERVDAILIAGDLFDRAHLSFATERFLLAQLGALGDAGIQVVYATGNHDPGNAVRAGGFEWPGNVTVIDGEEPVVVPVAGPDGSTAGYVTGVGHATSRVGVDLSRLLIPVPDTPLPQVALLHTLVTSVAGKGAHQPYAPSNLEHLRGSGFHYWALGHVHQRQELSADPPVHYCGNPQGRDARETGPKGGLLVDLGDPGHPVVEFREFSRVRWERLEVAGLKGAHTLDDLLTEVAVSWDRARSDDPGSGDTEWMVAVDLAGPSPLWRQLRDPEELATIADEAVERLGALGCEVRARKVHSPALVADHAGRQDALGAALSLCAEVRAGNDRLGLADTDLAGYDPERDGSLDAYLHRILDGAPEEILTRMLTSEGGLE
ncbi:MAG: DNA repair exonuclease [Gemmatimonadota bacterium]|nr:DNA repair exonuclease [Gemmatimonadota bacterium]MDE2983999.1 DNA repair exonuclease [Gemmatimonadota bacterium]